MAQHNPQSRAYLLIVMAGIVAGFTIASLLSGCSESEPEADQDAPPSSGAAKPIEGTSMDETPPIERPVDPDSMNPDSMMDDMSPPDEMLDEPLLDAVPDAVTTEPVPNDVMPEEPASDPSQPAQNP